MIFECLSYVFLNKEERKLGKALQEQDAVIEVTKVPKLFGYKNVYRRIK